MDRTIINKENRQLSELKKNDLFNTAFKKLQAGETLSNREKDFLFSCAIICFKNYNTDNRYRSYFKLGYYIILKYSTSYNDYRPLYDISLQIGFYPISDHLLKHGLIESNTITENIINKAISEKYISFEDYIETLEQNLASKAISGNSSSDIAYIAPTSYGKSSIMKEIIKRCDYNRVGIIVPTKSLLVQTYNEIKSMGLDYKLIMHDEMYNTNNSRFIGILTQERALRIITRNDVGFELLFIDEAHSLMSDNFRSIILSRLIRLNKIRRENQRIIYLSPLVNDCSNLNIKHINSNIITQSIKRDLKTYEIFLWENRHVFMYDRFTDQYFTIDEEVDFWQYIISKSKNKNFIYCYRPIQVEKIATELSNNIGEVEIDTDVKVAIKTLSREVHPSFYMISLLKSGVVYLHAKMPNIIKEYMEAMFKSEPSLKYIVANRVILEGINMPIDNMYITNTKRLDGKDLTNLIGRVNRLNHVFSSRGNLSSLISSIHFVANDVLIRNGGNMRNKIKLLRDSGFADNVQNPLLENYDAEALNLRESKREKNQSIVELTDLMLQTDNPDDDKSRIRKSLIDNGIDEVYSDIDLAAETIKRNIDKYIHNDELYIVDIIKKIFISNSTDNIFDYEVQRLSNEKAVAFYNNYLNVLQKLSLNERIGNFVSYFNEKAESDDPQLYIGGSYGEEPRITEMYNNGYSRNVYINLRNKSIEERVNLAIVKIKIEDDFVSYKLMKFIVFLKDFNIITEEYYNYCVYGTNNHSIIDLVRYGLSVSIVTKLTVDNQIENLYLDDYGNMRAKSNFNNYLSRQPELFKFEVTKYL